MASLPQKITEKFLEELSGSEKFTEPQIEALRELMTKTTKLKAAELEALLSPPEEDAL